MKASAAVSTSCSYLAFQALSAIALTPRSVQTARTSLNIMNSFHTSRNTIFKNMCIISSLNDVSRRRSGHTALFFLRQNCEIRTNRCKSTTVFSNAVRTLNHGLGDENTQILSSDIPVVYEAELIVKKSQFIGYASHCSSWPDAQRFLSNIKSLHPKARHLCYGFIGGGGGVSTMTERCSDDGEPTGTAGLPILGALKGEHLSDTACIVVRYFGGIKLGAGGLIRAYGGAAREVLKSSPTFLLVPKQSIRLLAPPSSIGSLYEVVNRFGGITSGDSYDNNGHLEITVTCKMEEIRSFKETLNDCTRGEIVFRDGEEDLN